LPDAQWLPVTDEGHPVTCVPLGTDPDDAALKCELLARLAIQAGALALFGPETRTRRAAPGRCISRREAPISSPIEFAARSALAPEERACLGVLVALVIPADAARGLPGADDPAILADILRSLGREEVSVREALRRLDELAGASFAPLDPAARDAVVAQFRQRFPALGAVIEEVVVRCYYRDDRVMRAIGMEPRPPYPKGFEVEPGDLSLLDPVRARGRIWREAP
jgi:hypothetical protein